LVGLGLLAATTPGPGQRGLLLAWLIVPTFAVAFSDVVTDALMVDVGQPRGLTGRLQSVQWACLYAASVLTGSLGGFLTETGLSRLGFLIGAALSGVTLILAVAFVREPPLDRPGRGPGEAWRTLRRAAGSRTLRGVGAF